MILSLSAPRPLAFLLLCCFLSAVVAQPLDENQLARAFFRWNAEGWNATTKEGEAWPSSGELGQLKSSDDDDTIWYYSAGTDFLGNKVEAYGGTIQFTLGHSEYNSLGLGNQEEYDIILESAVLGISLGHKQIVPVWVTSSENVVELSEEGGWVDTESGESASRLALIRTLSSLTGLKIRGSYYHGHEYSFLKDVILSKGIKQDLAWVRNDPHIDEICRALKLNVVGCEYYGVHLMKSIQKVNMNKLRAEYATQQRKRKEYESRVDDRRRSVEQDMLNRASNNVV
mmetsp:Transcript_14000/g.21785  ORF Transcript_14000/g.21785 Transcript_14000/m.21785 type:complete len:285 (-) Transcript_14000:172-1026(-)